MKIVLIGYRGSGKTTIGKHLATALNVPFIDTDHLIVSQAGMSIPEIFHKEGESGFRLRESRALKEALMLGRGVISTGGGIVLRPENRILIRTADLVVYLTAPVSILAERIRGDKNRPALTNLSLEEEIHTLLKERSPLYEELADLKIDTSTIDVNQAVAIILKKTQRKDLCNEALPS
ncbi:shikimate kinase [Thermospira aquatica]|uniref:Shikimate kinase n=1 Tax=Thermospira aquatica TaxID=2828656 RepID=A0AAX3BBV7_9SPIR|nr:shikimate kinase [Thermospira aquatica]URA09728.1 shikimate kinase [Thermospira aquatica]